MGVADGTVGVNVAVGGVGVGGIEVGDSVGGLRVVVLVGRSVGVGGTGVEAGAHPLAKIVRRAKAMIDKVNFLI